MKKITLFVFLMIFSLGKSQTIEGTWKMSPIAASFGVGPGLGNISWYANGAGDLVARACYFDDDYVFNANGTFANVQGSQTWLEGWQGTDGCGTPVAPHNGSNAATWAYDATAKTLTLTGLGAYIGLPKVFNNGELTKPADAKSTITYTVTEITSSSMTLDIKINGDGWWRFKLSKQGLAPTCTDGIKNGSETGVDCGGTCPNVCLTQINLPVTFEDPTVDYTVTDFEGTASTKVVDPTNSNNTVIKTVKGVGAKFYAGTSIGKNGLGFSAPIPFTVSNRKMYVRVWSPTAGTPVQLKVEDPLNGANSCETIANTTVANDWQTLEFDFNNQRPGTAAFNPAFNYKFATIFFNFVIDAPDSASDVTYYFDDVNFGAPLATNKFSTLNVKMYPNPASNSLTIEAVNSIERVSIHNILGQEMMVRVPNSKTVTLDISELQTGVYVVKTTIDGKIATSRVVKK